MLHFRSMENFDRSEISIEILYLIFAHNTRHTYYAGIMLNAFANLLCRHNWRKRRRIFDGTRYRGSYICM